ncbi:MAG: aminotransferase class V-fold PLP-dependent enzyme [Deltaproteobacteria bacterium]|nr:aminotransferase class V-fold PLP-dependent enzyme [Deltaproteobacteria bacterium]
MKNPEEYRAEFPVTQNYCYFNHAAIAPVPVRVTETLRRFYEEYARIGVAGYYRWMARVEEARSRLAGLIKATPQEVAFVGNTSEGLSAVATGINWTPGDVVLVPQPDFPANIYPWMNLERFGVNVKFYPRHNGHFDPDVVAQALVPRTRLLAVSSVDYITGFRCDLAGLGDFCRHRGLLLCVDAIQSLGVIPLDVKACGIHFLVAGSHKWLLGPMGCGCLYVAEEAASLVRPAHVGWKSVVHEDDFSHIELKLKTGARAFESGTQNVAGILALGEAVGLLTEVGLQQVSDRVLNLNSILYQGLQDRHLKVISPQGKDERSGILTFDIPGDPQALFQFFIDQNVSVSLRDGHIRLSPHFYNQEADAASFFEALDKFMGNGS